MHESSGDDCSYANKEEAELVDIYVRRLLSVGLQQEHIGVITPYNGQLEILRSLLNEEHPNLEIKTVDGFQV